MNSAYPYIYFSPHPQYRSPTSYPVHQRLSRRVLFIDCQRFTSNAYHNNAGSFSWGLGEEQEQVAVRLAWASQDSGATHTYHTARKATHSSATPEDTVLSYACNKAPPSCLMVRHCG